jgi:CzcA family heavy metal efflux pump
MIDALIRFSLRNRLLVLMAAAMVVGLGLYRASQAPVDVFPDVTAPTVTVVAEGHGLAPEEVERLVTFPIETALNGAPGLRRIRSSTGLGMAVVHAEFSWNVDAYRARQSVAERLQLVAGELPEPPLMTPSSSVMGEVMFIAVSSDTADARELRTLVDWTLRPRLLAVSGVSQVIPIGGERRQLEVALDPKRLSALHIPIDDVIDVVAQSNENAGGGVIIDGGKEWVVRGIGRVHNPEDLVDVVVAQREGRPITLSELGEVRMGNAFKRGDASFAAKPAVVIGIRKQPAENTMALTRRLDSVLDDLEGTLPPGIAVHRDVLRQADFIEVALDNVLEALRDGAFLVIVVVFPFLVSMRATIITALAIPLSLLITVLMLGAVGATIDTMSLGGMAIAVGAVVDDAIIDVENVVRRLRLDARKPLESRRGVFDVVLDASREIRGSIVFATLVIALVFLPLFFLSGVEGRLLQPLGIAYVVSLLASLVIAVTVTPVLCLMTLPTSATVLRERPIPLVKWLQRAYDPVLGWVLKHWLLLAAGSLILVLAAGTSLLFAGRSFLPVFNEGALTISITAPPGVTLQRSDELARMAEQTVLEHPAVRSVARRTGRAELDDHALGVHASEIDARLDPQIEDKEAAVREIREALGGVPGVTAVIGQPISHRIDHLMSGTRASIAVKVFGDDLRELRKVAEEVKSQVEAVEGTVDVMLEQQADVPQVHVKLDRRALARHGMTVGDVSTALEAIELGVGVSKIVEGQAAYDLVVRYGSQTKLDHEALRHLMITVPSGQTVPLHALAEVQRRTGPSTIARENVQRKIVIMSNVAGRDLLSVVDDIRQSVDTQVTLPDGIHIEYGGQFEAATRASRTIGLVSLVVVAGVFVLLVSAFRSPRDAVLVMLNLPLALVGGIVGMWVTDGIVSVASLVGFIALFGIATRNGIMLVSHVRHVIQKEGERDPVAAVRRAAQERLAPIVMTALATGLGLLPLALSLGEPGGEIQAPMAIVILSGLAGSTALNMLVIPSLYLRFGSAVRTLAD